MKFAGRQLGIAWIGCFVALAIGAEPLRAGAVRGQQGAVSIPIQVDRDCQATLVLCDKDDQVVRILAQVVPLLAGPNEVLWDGMDLWGNLVPAATALKLKVITNQQVRAIYEMAVGSSGDPAWLTGRTGEGDAMRQGGNLGDHSGPGSIAVAGNRVFFGSAVVEHGNNIMATNLAGEKMWGVQLKGWDGPEQMTSNGRTPYAVSRNGKDVFSVDPETFTPRKLFSADENPIAALAATKDRLVVVMRNHDATADPFARAKLNIDYARSVPANDGKKAPDYQLSGQARFETVFGTGGHFQTGFSIQKLDATTGQAVVVFTEPQEIGALLIGRVDGAVKGQYFVLKHGITFDPKSVSGSTLSDAWQPIGQTTFDRAMDVMTVADHSIKTNALLMRLTIQPEMKKLPSVSMCRIQPQRVVRIEAPIRVIAPANAAPNNPAAKQSIAVPNSVGGWDYLAGVPVSDVEPVTVTLDLGKTVTLRGISLLNCLNPHVEISALTQGASIDSATEDQWQSVVKNSARHDRRLGWMSGRSNFADRTIAFPDTVTTSSLRLKFTAGVMSVRGPRQIDENPSRVACSDVMLLTLADAPPKMASQFLQFRDLGGAIVSDPIPTDLEIKRIACDVAGDGSLYAITGDSLLKLSISGSNLIGTTLADKLNKPVSLTASAGRIAVGCNEDHAVFVFDPSGKKLLTIGNKGSYQRGPFDPTVINRADGVAFAPDGSIWVVEEAYHPKRMAHFSAQGIPIQDLWGPPEYGGGGYLDPTLKDFYYRGMDFGMDFATGKWGLRGFCDRYFSVESPATSNSSFTYTSIGRVIQLNGRKYAVGDGGGDVSISLLVDGVWKPAAVMGMAAGNAFLVNKSIWREHWLRQELKDSAYIWCDRNGDGQYQTEEVELFPREKRGFTGGAYWRSLIGDDLAVFNSNLRLAPSRITESGVPIYENSKIKEYDYDALAPIYRGNMIIGSLAKKGYGAASLVASDGSLVLEGQPWRVGPDLSIVGGPIKARPSDYQPPIAGLVMDNPLAFMGKVATKSTLGDVAMMNGVNGPWFLWSVKYGCVVGRIFTGSKGGWSGVPNVRGTNVTEHKQDWECFNGSVLRADNGNVYAVAGKGHHAISRIEGLDDYAVREYPLVVTAESVAANELLRPKLLARAEEKKKKGDVSKLQMSVMKLDSSNRFRLDGDLSDWSVELQPLHTSIDDDDAFSAASMRAGVASDDRAIYLAYQGQAVMKNSADDPKFIFKSGFCFDFAIRTNPKAKDNRTEAGDKRLLVGPIHGNWTAVLLDYVDKSIDEEQAVVYESPVASTRVARVTVLPESAVKVAVKTKPATKGAAQSFTAEIAVAWSALGLTAPPTGSLRGDVGVLAADATGASVETRWYWANPDTDAITDVAAEAQIQPANLGSFRFER